MKWLFFLVLLFVITPAFAQTNSQIVSTSGNVLELSISTEPTLPESGESTRLKMDFINPVSEIIQEHIDYIITVSNNEQDVFGPIPLTHTSSGSVSFPITFPEDGEYQGVVEIEGILFQLLPTPEIATFMINVGQSFAQSDNDQTGVQSTTTTTGTNTSNDGGCLIATAATGTEMSSQIQQLREIRNNIINTDSGNAFLQQFNQIYYTFSPTISDMERDNELFQGAVRLGITPLVSSILLLDYIDLNSENQVLGVGIGIIILNLGMYIIFPSVVIRQIIRYKVKYAKKLY